MNRFRRFSVFCFLVSVSFALFSAEPKVLEEIHGKVIGIVDGDTLTLQTGKDQLTVRLEGIDAPERNQAFGMKSREALKSLVIAKQAVVLKTGFDKYNRTLGIVKIDGTSVNATMVKDGWAWHFKKYSSDEALAQFEVEAREANRGLWADGNPISPWDFRDKKKDAPTAVSPVRVATPKAGSKANTKESEPVKKEKSYWLNSSTGVRHNSGCKHFGTTKNGRACDASEGKACGICGG